VNHDRLPLDALCMVEEAGFQAALVGGWSRELLGLEPARQHSDIDLVVTDPEISQLDAWCQRHTRSSRSDSRTSAHSCSVASWSNCISCAASPSSADRPWAQAVMATPGVIEFDRRHPAARRAGIPTCGSGAMLQNDLRSRT
jgi:hypothetical protein